MGRKPKAATPATPEPKPAAVTRRSTRRGRSGRSDSESEEPIAAPQPNYCEDSPDSHSEDDYSPSKKTPKRGGRRGRGSRGAASSGSDREAAVRTPKARGGGRGRRGGSILSTSPVKDLSVVMESSVVVEDEESQPQQIENSRLLLLFFEFKRKINKFL